VTSTADLPNESNQLSTPAHVSDALGVSQGVLAGWRHRRLALPYLKVGSLVRYDPLDVHAWLTGDPDGTSRPSEQGQLLVASSTWSPSTLAHHLAVDVALLAAWRHRHQGPPFVKRHGRVEYRVLDVREWLSQNTKATVPGSLREERNVAKHATCASQRLDRRRLAA